MTLCKYECMILSHDGSKILTACRMLQISIAHRQMKAKIHSFPTMYILGGVDVVEMGQIKVFVQELGLKTSISAEQNLDLLTLAGSGTHKFWSVTTFDTTPQKFGEFRSKWAMGMSGSFKIVPTQASYIFSTSGPQKTQKKGSFRILTNYSNAKIFKGYPGYANGKLTSRAFWKCGSFCCYNFLNPSYGCSKSTESEILAMSAKIRNRSEK